MRYLRSGCGSFWPVAGGVRGFGLLGVLGGMRHTRSPWPGPQPACTGRIRPCPPFRSPHHSASLAALIGGGSGVPVEVVLAHRAVS